MKKITEKLNNEKTAGKILILPALLGTFIFIVIPVFFSFYLSFFNWDLLDNIKFVGFENYKELILGPSFAMILKNTFIFALSTALIALKIPLVLAALINNKIRGS